MADAEDNNKDEVQIKAALPPEAKEAKEAKDKESQHFLSRSDKVEISSRVAEKKKKSKIAGSLFKTAVSLVQEQDISSLTPFLPSDIIGGSVPYVAGMEDETVWNAAAQACGTERVHYCYTVADNRCWYLAVPSASLASAPDSWCPIAAALPGNSEYWDRDTVYLYEQDGVATALRWDSETGRMQVFVGAARSILPRIQSMEANFVTISAEKAKIVPWRNMTLNRERLSRNFMRITFFSGLAVTFFALTIWALSFAYTTLLKPELKEAEELTKNATFELLIEATKALNSNVGKHMANMRVLMDTLPKFGGTLVRYEIMEGGQVEWEALVPRALESDLSQFRAKAIGLEKNDGRLRIKGSN